MRFRQPPERSGGPSEQMAWAIKQHWHDFQHGRPGKRFQDRYQAHRKQRKREGFGGKLARIVLAIGCLLVGVVLMFIPGPAILFFFIAGTLLASDSLPIARMLDAIEVRLRAWWKVLRAFWTRLNLGWKIVVVVLAALSSAGMTYLTYRFVWA